MVYRNLSIAVIVLCVCLAAPVAAADEIDIVGKYKDGGTTLQIVKRGEVYQVRWDYGGGKEDIGVGILADGILSVAYDSSKGGSLGIAVYKVEKGGKGPKLVGKWAGYNDKKVALGGTIEFVSK